MRGFRPPPKIAYFIILLALLGIYLRTFEAKNYIPFDTVVSYYFDKTSRLLENGDFPQKDIWDFAPSIRAENAPPGLAYITALLYTPLSFLGLSFYNFASIFPVFIFGIWLMVLFFLFRDLFGTKVALASTTILTFTPVSVALTRLGHYFQESLGSLFIFISVYCTLKVFERDNYTVDKKTYVAGISFITLLILTWQQFVLFYLGAVLFFAGRLIVLKRQMFFHVMPKIFYLIIPLISAEFISKIILGIKYSPFAIIYEFILGFVNRHNQDLLIAMRKTDWANPDIGNLYDYFGLAGIILVILGIINMCLDIKNPKKWFIVILSAIGVGVMSAFVKERFLAFTLLLFLFGLGLQTLFYERPQNFILFIKKIIKFMGAGVHTKFAILLIIICSALVLWSSNISYTPPTPTLILRGGIKEKLGKPSPVSIILTNNGGRQASNDEAFSGVHVEVENGTVTDIKALAPNTISEISTKSYSQAGNIFFFETKFDRINPGENAGVSFRVAPYSRPVKIYYRGWIPSVCSRQKQKEVLTELLPGWRSLNKSGWRNEECIERVPANEDQGYSFCKVPVFAAHLVLQNFRCFTGPEL